MASPPGPAQSAPLSGERISETRRAIHQHLQQSNVYGQIREILATYAADHTDFNPNSPDDVMHVLRERGMVQQILGSIGDTPQRSVPLAASAVGAAATSSVTGVGSSRTSLYVRLAGGRAFLDNIDAAVLEARRKAQEQMVVHMHFGTQRFRSNPLPASCDPAFDDDFLINFEPSVREIADCSTPLHVLVTMSDAHGAKSRTIGENVVEWRRVLRKGTLNLAVELAGMNPSVPAGILDLQLELLPFAKRLTDDEIQYRIEQSKATQSAADREFLVYARRWWSQYHAISPSFAQRRVKVFAQSLSGRMLPVTHYVDVMQPDRVFDGPEDAARFVSLLGADQPSEDAAANMLSGLRAGPAEQWLGAFAFLAQGRGDSPNHATLLTSLLLGFGLDAYCVVGASHGAESDAAAQESPAGAKGTRMLVLTRHRAPVADAPEPAFRGRIWDPVAGTQHDLLNTEEHGLLTVDCMFNHARIFGNAQSSSRVETVSLDLENEAEWFPFYMMKLRMVPRQSPTPPLLWVPLRERQIAMDLEARLKDAISKHRDTLSAPTLWDDELATLFSQALAKYENGRRDADAAVDVSLFSEGIRTKIGEGRTFKGFPVNVTHTSEARILAAVLANTTGKAVVEAQHDETFLSVRCRVTVFPEGVISVWVMLGARYRARMI